MSTPIGTGPGQTTPSPTGKVNFGWLSESFQIFTQAAVTAGGTPAVDAVTKSINLMKTDLLAASLFAFVFQIIALLGMIPCFLGMLAISPMLYIISALALRDMGGGIVSGGDGNPTGPTDPSPWPPLP